jgi:hypothetical protein
MLSFLLNVIISTSFYCFLTFIHSLLSASFFIKCILRFIPLHLILFWILIVININPHNLARIFTLRWHEVEIWRISSTIRSFRRLTITTSIWILTTAVFCSSVLCVIASHLTMRWLDCRSW